MRLGFAARWTWAGGHILSAIGSMRVSQVAGELLQLLGGAGADAIFRRGARSEVTEKEQAEGDAQKGIEQDRHQDKRENGAAIAQAFAEFLAGQAQQAAPAGASSGGDCSNDFFSGH